MNIKVDAGYRYCVDEDGDIARISYEQARKNLRREGIMKRATPRLARPLEIPLFVLQPGQAYRILSIHPPWAWSILFAGKDIENRSWSTPYRGPMLIHASSRKYVGANLDEARAFIAERSGMSVANVPTAFPRSQIIGAVDLIDCVREHPSPWAGTGSVNWVLSHPRRLAQPVLNVDGKLNLWTWTCP